MPSVGIIIDKDEVRELIDTLWVPGVAANVLALGWLAVADRIGAPGTGSGPLWLLYLFFGIVLPVTLFIIAARDNIRSELGPVATPLKAIASVSLVAFLLVGAFHECSPWVTVPVALQLAISALRLRNDKTSGDRALTLSALLRGAVGCLVSAYVWNTVLRIVWWIPWTDALGTDAVSVALAIGAVVLTVFAIAKPAGEATLNRVTGPAYAAVFVPGILLLGFASLRHLGSVSDPHFVGFHHWGVFAGVVQMVRQGGWLLWDVPSQYGFLSMLTIAAVPAKSAWQSIYVVMAVAQCMTAFLVVAIYRARGSGFANVAFGFAITLGAIFLEGGRGFNLLGPQTWPSSTAIRYGWAYTLIALLLYASRQGRYELAPTATKVAGCAIWLIGCLWSVESAFYCTSIWVPSFAFLLYRDHDANSSRRLKSFAGWFALPFVMLASAIALIQAIYTAKLGHGPDWMCYADYLRLAGSGAYGHAGVKWDEYIWRLVIVAIPPVCATPVIWRVARRWLADPVLGLLIGLWALYWSVSSFYIAENHPANLEGTGIIAAMLFGGILLALDSFAPSMNSNLVRSAAIGFLGVFMAIAFGNASVLRSWCASTLVMPTSNVDAFLPTANPTLTGLLQTASVKPNEPLVFMGSYPMPTVPTDNPDRMQGRNPMWLPCDPYTLIDPLPPDRAGTYTKRYLERVNTGGWGGNVKADPTVPLFENTAVSAAATAFVTPVKRFETDEYRLTLYLPNSKVRRIASPN